MVDASKDFTNIVYNELFIQKLAILLYLRSIYVSDTTKQ